MGILRLFLALSVIAGHAGTTILGFNGIGAWYAVNLFFIISGFYMAMVLNEKYKETDPIHFYKSRIFRLFPVYYVGLLISLIVSFGVIADFFDRLSIGAKIFFLIQNLFIFGQDLSYLICVKTISNECANPIALTINPPAWSLAVELGFYLLAPFVLKSAKKTFMYVLFGCIYLVSINSLTFPLASLGFIRPVESYAFNYYLYASSFVFFGGGALAYHLYKEKVQVHYFAALGTILLLSFTQTIMPFWHLFFICLAIPPLFNYTAKNKLDRVIGELSYPAYILHFPILLFLRPYAAHLTERFSYISLGTIVAIVSCLFGLLLYFFLEKRIDNYRNSESFFHNKAVLLRQSHGKIAARSILIAYLFFPFYPLPMFTTIRNLRYIIAQII